MNDPICIDREIMNILRTEDVIAATGGEVISGGTDPFSGVSIDSRKINSGELFVALKGDRFDGHDYLCEALRKGSGAVVSRPVAEPVKGKTIISVRDTLKALQDVAHFLRVRRGIPAVAVTGSNGKTTTKELIAAVLGSLYRVLKNSGNLNNNIGLPLSLTRIVDEDEVIVLEMGASGPGEIKDLCDIAAPDYGVLTNVSPTHLEGFKDLNTIRKTKLELLDAVRIAVVNADDSFLMKGVDASGFRGTLVRYGIQSPAEVFATDIELHERGLSFALHVPGSEPLRVDSKLSGMFNVYNLLAAASVGHLFGIDPAGMQNAINAFTGVPMRLEFRELNGALVISDMYNANPASMEAAIRELVRTKRGRTIAVLGDMLELGTYEEEAHRRVGGLLSELRIDVFVAVGPRMALAAQEFTGEVHKLKTAAEAGRLLRGMVKKDDTLLLKGSRAMGMEKVLEEYAL